VSPYVCPPEHRHAEVGTCYVIHRCRCTPCRELNGARERERNRLKAYGRYDKGLVDAAPVRAHVEFLRSSGMGYKTIAARAGVGTTGVRTLIYGREDYVDGGKGPRHGEMLKQVARVKAEKILAVQPTLENLPQIAHVSARGTIRRVRALIAFGWSQTAIAAAVGVDEGTLSLVMRRYAAAESRGRAARVKVRASTARAMVRAYEQMSSTPPPRDDWQSRINYSRSVRIGRERGWPLPMDWEAFDNEFERIAPINRSVA
jgi:hypothetical protein